MDPNDIWNPEPAGADAPREGFYSLERSNAVALPIRIWFGPPEDARARMVAPRWNMMVGDRHVDPASEEFDRHWPYVAKNPLGATPAEAKAEYEYRMARIGHAKEHGARSDPWARRSGKIDLLTAPIPE